MPRDANGNYTLPAGNPVVTNTLITSTWANGTMSDMANEMQDSLSRSGKGGFTAPVGIVDKSGSVPGLNFITEPTSGFKREASEDLRMQVTATDVWQALKTGVKILTPNSGGVLKHPVVEESGLNVMRGAGGTTVLYFYNDTPPTGWTLNAPDANIRELVIGPSGAGQGGVIGGSIDPTALTGSVSTTVTVSITGATDGHVLDISQMPSHNHPGSTAPQSSDTGGADGTRRAARNATGNGTVNVAPQGGGLAHTHTLTAVPGTGTGTGSLATVNPRYARGILATLDA